MKTQQMTNDNDKRIEIRSKVTAIEKVKKQRLMLILWKTNLFQFICLSKEGKGLGKGGKS